MTEIRAALARAHRELADARCARREAWFEMYRTLLSRDPGRSVTSLKTECDAYCVNLDNQVDELAGEVAALTVELGGE